MPQSGSGTGYVLVHGGNHSSECWDRLRDHLDAEIRAVDLPGRGSRPADLRRLSLGDLRDAVVEEIDQVQSEHVVVVGHSFAGTFVPAAVAVRPNRVTHLVLVAAVIPPEGRTQRANMPPLGRAALRLLTRDGILRPAPRRLARIVFCHDMDRPTAEWHVGGLVPEAARLFDEPVSRRGMEKVPATYVRLTRDRAVTRRLADRQVANYGAGISVCEVDSGHGVMISHPERLAEILKACSAGDG